MTPVKAFFKYHETSEPWEHQALIKGRLVAGNLNEEWVKSLQNNLKKTVYEWSFPQDFREQIHHMRQRKEIEIAKETPTKKDVKERHCYGCSYRSQTQKEPDILAWCAGLGSRQVHTRHITTNVNLTVAGPPIPITSQALFTHNNNAIVMALANHLK